MHDFLKLTYYSDLKEYMLTVKTTQNIKKCKEENHPQSHVLLFPSFFNITETILFLFFFFILFLLFIMITKAFVILMAS